MTDRKDRIAAFLAPGGWAAASRVPVAGDASNRSYARLTRADGVTAILMDAPPQSGEDVRPFIAMADHLRDAGLSAPEIYRADTEAGLLLIEDFGEAQFARLIAEDPARQQPLYRDACDLLLALREMPKPPLQTCDGDWLADMIAPVFEWYAPETDPALVARFDAAFRPLAQEVAAAGTIVMLRDYHVENLMLLEERQGIARVGLLDFQDAMLAHPAYDLVSILQDARREVPLEMETAMLSYYLGRSGENPERFRMAYAMLGLQRNLRILGVFARLCLRDGRPRYIDMIPRLHGYVLRNLTHPQLSPLAPLLAIALPDPTADFLQTLKSRCQIRPSQP